jgi:hypothetical protein
MNRLTALLARWWPLALLLEPFAMALLALLSAWGANHVR